MEQSDNFPHQHDFIGELPEISPLTYADWIALTSDANLSRGGSNHHHEPSDGEVISKETLDEMLHRGHSQFMAVDTQDTSDSGSGFETFNDPSTLPNSLEYFTYPSYYPHTPEPRAGHLQGGRPILPTSSSAEAAFSRPMEFNSTPAAVGATNFAESGSTAGNPVNNRSNVMVASTNTDYQPERTSLHETNKNVAMATEATAQLTFNHGYENHPDSAGMTTPYTGGFETQASTSAMNTPQGQTVQVYANSSNYAPAAPAVSNPHPVVAQPMAQVSASQAHSDRYTHAVSSSTDNTPQGTSNQGQSSSGTTAPTPMQPVVSTSQPPAATASVVLNNGPKDEVIMDEDFEEEEEEEEEIVLQFSSVEEANDYRPDRAIPPPYDPTVPETLEEKKAIVTQLLREMKGIEHAEDNAGMIRPFRDRKHSMQRMEVVCWNILDAAILRQRVGPLLTPEEERLKNKTPTVIANFTARLNHMINCLRTQKTICKHLLDPFYLFQFVDDPPFAKYRVMSNKTLNKKKSDFIVAGKKVLGHSKSSGRGKRGAKQNAAALSTPFSTPKRGSRNTATQAVPADEGSSSVADNSQTQNQTMTANSAQMASPAPIMYHPGARQAQEQQMLSTPTSYASYTSTPITQSAGYTPNTEPAHVHGVAAYNNQVVMAPGNTTPYRRSPLNRLYHASSQQVLQYPSPGMASPQVGAPQLPTPPTAGPNTSNRQAKPRGKASRRKRSVDESGSHEYNQPSPQKKQNRG